jgi:hypothetical protein
MVTDDREFVPAGFMPPTRFVVGDFRLEPLGAQHNDSDHAAWMSSIDYIRLLPGFPYGCWPREMSLADNLSDLERHADDFAEGRGFTYTVLDANEAVVGCLYIYPTKDGVHDTHVRSWLCESEARYDEAFRQAIAEWLGSDAWPFNHPLYEPLLD